MPKKTIPVKISQKKPLSKIKESEQNTENIIKKNHNALKKDSSITLKEKLQSDIIPHITNITVCADLNSKLDLKSIALELPNCEYNPSKIASLRVKLKNPKCHANIFTNGKIVCLGLKSEEQIKKALIEYGNMIKKCGYDIKLKLDEVIITNIAASCNIKFTLPLSELYNHLKKIKEADVNIEYEKDIFPAVIYSKQIENSKMKLMIFSSGKIVITGAKKKEYIYDIFNHIYPELLKFKN